MRGTIQLQHISASLSQPFPFKPFSLIMFFPGAHRTVFSLNTSSNISSPLIFLSASYSVFPQTNLNIILLKYDRVIHTNMVCELKIANICAVQ